MAMRSSGRRTPSIPSASAAGPTATPAASAASTIDRSAQLLDDLMGRTDQAIADVENRPQTVVDLAKEFAAMGERFDAEAQEAVRSGDAESLKRLMAAAKEKILHGTLQSLTADAAIEQTDLAKMLATFSSELAVLDREFENIDEPPAEAKELVAAHEAAVTTAKAAIEEAKQSFFIGRKGRVANAEEALQRAEAQLAVAREDAKTLAAERLRSANFEQSFQRIQLLATRIAEIMQRCLKATKERQTITAERRRIALGLKAQAAEALEKVTAQHVEAEDQLRAEQERLEPLTNGTKAYVDQETRVADARAKVEDLNGRRTAALAILQSKERFVQQHELFEAALQKVASNLRAMIAVLQSDTEERIHTFAARLQTQKGAQQQEAGLQLARIAREQDQRNLVAAAAFASEAERANVEFLATQKDAMARQASTVAGFEEAHAANRQMVLDILKETAEYYGLDIKAEQYFSYGKDQSKAAPAKS